MQQKYKKVTGYGFANCLTHPTYLSVLTLSDNTRKHLIEYYTLNSTELDEFRQVINTLSKEYSGDIIHDCWIEYTTLMETVRKNNIIDIVPQLILELRKK
jgi:hypothetical protein